MRPFYGRLKKFSAVSGFRLLDKTLGTTGPLLPSGVLSAFLGANSLSKTRPVGSAVCTPVLAVDGPANSPAE